MTRRPVTARGNGLGASSLVTIVILAFCFLIQAENTAHAQQWANNGADIYATNTGNVGIGTTTPFTKLYVLGNFLVEGAGTNGTFYGNSSTTDTRVRIDSGAAATTKQSILTLSDKGIDKWQLVKAADNHFLVWDSASSADRFHIVPNGNVGIGTTAPTEKLYVSGNIYATGNITCGGTCSGGSSQWTTSGTSIYYNGGNVGIGTTAPTSRMHVKQFNNGGNSFGSGLITERFDATNQAAFYVGSDNQAYIQAGSAGGGYLTVQSGGNVGIGTTSPSSKLHVAGDVTVTGNISAKYQDIAEWVSTEQPIPPGNVVVLDSANKNFVKSSYRAYDTRVAGVVSTNPGIVLGEADETKVKVATTGRVLVRVDARSAPIEVGDLLVSSDQEGMAMRSEPVEFAGVRMHRPGTIIGKALEPLAYGDGEILVLLSLQ